MSSSSARGGAPPVAAAPRVPAPNVPPILDEDVLEAASLWIRQAVKAVRMVVKPSV